MRGLVRTGGWLGFGFAILVGALLPVVVFLKSNDLLLRHLPWAMLGGAAAGALAGGILLGLDRLKGRKDQAP
jgi:hypothetical protein